MVIYLYLQRRMDPCGMTRRCSGVGWPTGLVGGRSNSMGRATVSTRDDIPTRPSSLLRSRTRSFRVATAPHRLPRETQSCLPCTMWLVVHHVDHSVEVSTDFLDFLPFLAFV